MSYLSIVLAKYGIAKFFNGGRSILFWCARYSSAVSIMWQQWHKRKKTRYKCMGTIFTFVACCYKNYICISTIVTQNTLKCAISRAKFHFCLRRGTAPPQTPPQWGVEWTPHPTSSSDLMHSPPPFQKSWIHHCIQLTVTGRLHGPIVGPTGRSDLSVRPVGWSVYTFRSSDRPVGPTQAMSTVCQTSRTDRLDRL